MRRDLWTDVALRSAGVVALSIALLAGNRLGTSAGVAVAGPSLRIAMLAALTFLCASLGAILLCCGVHLLDRIEVSSRWRELP